VRDVRLHPPWNRTNGAAAVLWGASALLAAAGVLVHDAPVALGEERWLGPLLGVAGHLVLAAAWYGGCRLLRRRLPRLASALHGRSEQGFIQAYVLARERRVHLAALVVPVLVEHLRDNSVSDDALMSMEALYRLVLVEKMAPSRVAELIEALFTEKPTHDFKIEIRYMDGRISRLENVLRLEDMRIQ